MKHREHREHREGASAELSERVLGAAIEVHRELEPGLLESAYEACLCHELALAGLAFKKQWELSVEYRGLRLGAGFRADLIVEDELLIELKTVDKLLPIHTAQVLTYLKFSGLRVGLLLNLNERVLRDGIKRLSL